MTDRDARFNSAPAGPGEPETAARRRSRRVVLDDARRRVERALLVAPAAEELASAVEGLLRAADSGERLSEGSALDALRKALKGYVQARGA